MNMRIILFLSVLSDIPSLYARGFTPVHRSASTGIQGVAVKNRCRQYAERGFRPPASHGHQNRMATRIREPRNETSRSLLWRRLPESALRNFLHGTPEILILGTTNVSDGQCNLFPDPL